MVLLLRAQKTCRSARVHPSRVLLCPLFFSHASRWQLRELECLPATCQRVFNARKNAAETVWLICRQGDVSPNRQYSSEPFEDVLRRGHCSEVRAFLQPQQQRLHHVRTVCLSRLWG